MSPLAPRRTAGTARAQPRRSSRATLPRTISNVLSENTHLVLQQQLSLVVESNFFALLAPCHRATLLTMLLRAAPGRQPPRAAPPPRCLPLPRWLVALCSSFWLRPWRRALVLSARALRTRGLSLHERTRALSPRAHARPLSPRALQLPRVCDLLICKLYLFGPAGTHA